MATELRKHAKDLVDEARSQIENLTSDQVEQELQNSDVVLIDVRDNEERLMNGSIPGAIHVIRGMLEFRADPTTPYHNEALQPDRRIIVHCGSGGRSALAAKTLKDMGYSNVAHLDDGFDAWKESGKAVE